MARESIDKPTDYQKVKKLTKLGQLLVQLRSLQASFVVLQSSIVLELHKRGFVPQANEFEKATESILSDLEDSETLFPEAALDEANHF